MPLDLSHVTADGFTHSSPSLVPPDGTVARMNCTSEHNSRQANTNAVSIYPANDGLTNFMSSYFLFKTAENTILKGKTVSRYTPGVLNPRSAGQKWPAVVLRTTRVHLYVIYTLTEANNALWLCSTRQPCIFAEGIVLQSISGHKIYPLCSTNG